jgi:protein gp37
MLNYFTAHRRSAPDFEQRVPGPSPVQRVQALVCDYVRLGRFQPHGYGPVYPEDRARARTVLRPFPLSNVWLGVSAEDQKRADERIPDLLATPAAVRFVSAEPLLGPIDLQSDLRRYLDNGLTSRPAGIDWIIVGGESGLGARPIHPDWARGLRDQCNAAGVAFFFKQWGASVPRDQAPASLDDGECLKRRGRIVNGWYVDVGKKAAGRFLDGREWNDMPDVAEKAVAA